MVLVDLPTTLGDFVRANVHKYSSTIEHMGMVEWFGMLGNGWENPQLANSYFFHRGRAQPPTSHEFAETDVLLNMCSVFLFFFPWANPAGNPC